MNNNTGLAKFIRFGIYLTAFVPLIIFREFISPFNFGKIIIFRSLIEILGVAYLILILKDRSWLPRIDKIFWSFIGFIAVFVITALTSVNVYNSLWGNIERMGGLWNLLHYFLFYIILTSAFNKRTYWHNIFNIIIFSGVISAIYGFFQKTDINFFVGSGGRERIIGTIGNAGLFAGYEIFIIFLSMMMLFKARSKGGKIWYSSAFIISSIGLLMTAVRGALLGYGIGLIVFAFLWTQYNKSELGKGIFKGLIVLAIVFVGFSLLFKDSLFVKNSRYLSRITNLSFTSVTVQTRFMAWRAGIEGWKETPKNIIFGWGPENFNYPFTKHFNPKFYTGIGSENLFDRAHNMFIEALVTMGLIGFIAYTNIFVSIFSRFKRILSVPDEKIYGIGLIPLLVAYLLHNFFFLDGVASYISFFTVAGFISYISAEPGEETKRDPIIKSKLFVYILTAAALIFAIFLAYKINILSSKANYATTRGIVAGQKGDFKTALAKFKEALIYDVPGKYEFRHRLAQYLIGKGGPSVHEPVVADAHLYAISEVEKNIKENPGDHFPYLYISRLYINLGKNDPKSPYNDKALEYSMKVLDISPTFIRTYHEIAQAHLNKKDYAKAAEYFQKAIDLNPSSGVHYWYLGSVKLEAGDEIGFIYLEKALNAPNPYILGENDHLRLVNYYLKQNNFQKIAEIYERIVFDNPNNPQHHASLAVAYAKLGRLDDAEKTARKAAELDPSFEDDARIFLRSIGRDF